MTTQPIERPDANQLLLTGGKAPESADFGPNPPSRVQGQLMNGPTTYHAREYDAKNPGQGPLRYWQDNNPVYGVYVDLDMPGLGLRRLYIEKLRMTSAVQEAMLRARVHKLEHGGWLVVDWTGTEPGQGNLAANTYHADWTPPSAQGASVPHAHAVLGNGGPMTQPAQPVPAQWQQQPQAAPPAEWQQGVPGAVNAPPAQVPPYYPTMPSQQPYNNGGGLAQVQPVTPPSQPMPVTGPPAQPAAPVLTETVAAAMRNAGIPTDGYVVVPG